MADMRAKFIVSGVQEHFSDEAKTIKTGETLAMSPVGTKHHPDFTQAGV